MGFVDEYLLYADVDLVFQHDVTVYDFMTGEPPKPPKYFTMGTELFASRRQCGTVDTPHCGNAGVMLINVPAMRASHSRFIGSTFTDKYIAKGLYFPEFGPVDQGAINRFYVGRFDVLDYPLFNWKPYWGYCMAAKIVHFHGPKPLQYLPPRPEPEA